MRTATAVAALAAALAGAAAAAQGLVEWREQVVPGVCVLRLAVPEGWSVESGTPAPGAVRIRLVATTGARAEVLITGTAAAGDDALKSTGDIKKATRAMGEEMLAGAVERKLELERLDGADGSGFFYTLTDKRADLPDGEFRVTTQGIMAIGPLRLAVTVLAGEKGSAAAKMTSGLLRTADCQAVRR